MLSNFWLQKKTGGDFLVWVNLGQQKNASTLFTPVNFKNNPSKLFSLFGVCTPALPAATFLTKKPPQKKQIFFISLCFQSFRVT